MASSLIYALDFDGVICDSAPESSRTALLSAKRLWPHLQLPTHHKDSFPGYMINAMIKIRPVIETGYENVLLGRLVSETPEERVEQDFVEPVLNGWEEVRERVMGEWDVSKEKLVEAFGGERDIWIDSDMDVWLDTNKFFPGIVDAINNASVPVYIITTKQTRFCQLLLRRNGITTDSVSDDHIYGFGMGSKITVLKKLITMPENTGKTVCFVEDRFETLEKVSLSMLGQPLELFLATWGYNTQKSKEVADKHPFINLLDLNTFISKFQ